MKYLILSFFISVYCLNAIEYTSNHLKLADELIELNEMKDVSVESIAEEVMGYFEFDKSLSNYSNIKEEYVKSFKNDYMVEVRDIYVSYYSEEEIENLLQFYKTELGQKLLKTTDLLSRDITMAAEMWTQRIYSKLESMANEESK